MIDGHGEIEQIAQAALDGAGIGILYGGGPAPPGAGQRLAQQGFGLTHVESARHHPFGQPQLAVFIRRQQGARVAGAEAAVIDHRLDLVE